MLLAQIQTVDPNFLQSFALVVAGLIGGAAGVATVWRVFHTKEEKRTVQFQPPELSGNFTVTPKGRGFSAESCDAKHHAIEHRLSSHDQQIKELWCTLREEDNKTREMLTRAIHEFDKTINRIDGTLVALDKSTDKIIQKIFDSRSL